MANSAAKGSSEANEGDVERGPTRPDARPIRAQSPAQQSPTGSLGGSLLRLQLWDGQPPCVKGQAPGPGTPKWRCTHRPRKGRAADEVV